MEEIWGDIPGYEGLYQVSNLGRVRSLDRWVNSGNGTKALKKGKILKLHYSGFKGQRVQVGLCKNGIHQYPLVHRLVYEAFNGPIPEGMQVNHIDENPANNNLNNLNLMTPKENTNWGTGIERRAKTCSETLKGKKTYHKNNKAKRIIEFNKTNEAVCEWFTIKAAAEYHKKHYTTIMLILEGRTKTLRDGTYFRYKEKEAV